MISIFNTTSMKLVQFNFLKMTNFNLMYKYIIDLKQVKRIYHVKKIKRLSKQISRSIFFEEETTIFPTKQSTRGNQKIKILRKNKKKKRKIRRKRAEKVVARGWAGRKIEKFREVFLVSVRVINAFCAGTDQLGPMLSAGCLHALLDFRTHRAGMKNQPVAGINTVKRSHCSLRRRIRGRHEPAMVHKRPLVFQPFH